MMPCFLLLKCTFSVASRSCCCRFLLTSSSCSCACCAFLVCSSMFLRASVRATSRSFLTINSSLTVREHENLYSQTFSYPTIKDFHFTFQKVLSILDLCICMFLFYIWQKAPYIWLHFQPWSERFLAPSVEMPFQESHSAMDDNENKTEMRKFNGRCTATSVWPQYSWL